MVLRKPVKMIHKITKKILISGFCSLGGVELLRLCNRTPRVVFWHGVDFIKDPLLEAESIRVEVFEKQLEYLLKRYEIISMDEFYSRYSNRSFNGKEIVLTFDDGYRNNLTVAAPILNRYSLPFTVFVSANHIDTQELFPTSVARMIIIGSSLNAVQLPGIGFEALLDSIDDRIAAAANLGKLLKRLPHHKVVDAIRELTEKISLDEYLSLKDQFTSLQPMTWQEVREIRSSGATVGSHCLDHFCCHENQTEDETKRQLSESKKIIEQQIGAPCHYFAYPNGDYTEISNKAVHEAGYRLGFSVFAERFYAPSEDSASLPRQGLLNDFQKFSIMLNWKPLIWKRY